MYEPVYKMLTTPWPKAERQPGDPNLVRMLFSVYAGRDGAATLEAQYQYNAIVLEEQNKPSFSELFDAASCDQKTHLRHLGRLIACYGGDPRRISYAGGQAIPWNAAALRHEKHPQRMLENAAWQEGVYFQNLQRISRYMHGTPKQVLERIMQDAQHHRELFEFARKNA